MICKPFFNNASLSYFIFFLFNYILRQLMISFGITGDKMVKKNILIIIIIVYDISYTLFFSSLIRSILIIFFSKTRSLFSIASHSIFPPHQPVLYTKKKHVPVYHYYKSLELIKGEHTCKLQIANCN